MARFDVVLTPDLYDGGYTVTVPALLGCITDGRTVDEALENAKEAIDVYLDGSTEDELAAAGARFDVLIESVEVPKYVVQAASVSLAAD